MFAGYVDEQLQNSVFLKAEAEVAVALTEVLSHANYIFDCLRFCCGSSILADSNQIGIMKWLSQSVI